MSSPPKLPIPTVSLPSAPPGTVDVENDTPEPPPQGYGITGILRRWKHEDMLNRGSLGLRAFGFLFSLLDFIIMVSNQHGPGRNFDEYEEYRYALAIAILSTLYSGLQSWRQIQEMSTGKEIISTNLALIDFFGDQIIAYLLISAASAAVPMTNRMREGADNIFTDSSAACISMEFFAFFVLGLSAMLSGYALAIAILSTLYSGLQSWRQIQEMSTGKEIISTNLALIDFFGDQIIAYLLISAASAAVPMTNRMREGADNIFTDSSAACISMEFFAFFVLGLSAMLSGYALAIAILSTLYSGLQSWRQIQEMSTGKEIISTNLALIDFFGDQIIAYLLISAASAAVPMTNRMREGADNIFTDSSAACISMEFFAFFVLGLSAMLSGYALAIAILSTLYSGLQSWRQIQEMSTGKEIISTNLALIDFFGDQIIAYLLISAASAAVPMTNRMREGADNIFTDSSAACISMEFFAFFVLGLSAMLSGYALAIAILSTLYSGLQSWRQIQEMSTGKEIISTNLALIDFFGDQIIAYLLISAASAAVPMTNRMREGADNIFTDSSAACISMEFFAFFVLGLSAMLSGYALAIAILSTLYSGLQSWRQIQEMSTGKEIISTNLALIDFFGDQIIAYLLISAASAAVPMTNRMREGADNIFTDSSAACISMEFFAFFVLGLSAMLSGYKLAKHNYM